jgi:hypothetical protein
LEKDSQMKTTFLASKNVHFSTPDPSSTKQVLIASDGNCS